VVCGGSTSSEGSPWSTSGVEVPAADDNFIAGKGPTAEPCGTITLFGTMTIPDPSCSPGGRRLLAEMGVDGPLVQHHAGLKKRLRGAL
jgi:hypothetical protein